MLELLITACLAADLSRCKTVSITYAAEGVTPSQCTMASMPEVAHWSIEHPNLVPMRWTCRSAGQRADI